MKIQGRCEKAESVEAGLKLTIYITDEEQINEAFKLRKKDVTLSIKCENTEDGTNKEAVTLAAEKALRLAIGNLYPEKGTTTPEGEQLTMVA